jgi:hypothetical protein
VDEFEREAILRRSAELMEQVDRVNEARRAREERGEAGWQLPTPRPEPSPHPRPPERVTRDWAAEAQWVRSIVQQQMRDMQEAIGMVVAEERRRTDKALATMRTELRAEMLSTGQTELRDALNRMSGMLERIERLGPIDLSREPVAKPH